MPDVQKRPACSSQKTPRECAVQVLRCSYAPAEITQSRNFVAEGTDWLKYTHNARAAL